MGRLINVQNRTFTGKIILFSGQDQSSKSRIHIMNHHDRQLLQYGMPSSFDFAGRLQFKTISNLFRTRSDICVAKHCEDFHYHSTTTADPWTVPNIDISLRRQLASTYSSLVDKISKGNQKKWEKSGVNISKPKVFDKNTEKRIPFVTFFRSPSARTARIQVIREGSCLHEVYQPAGPHVFRRDDFHFVYGTEIGKPRFVSSYNRDHGKLDLPKKYVSVDAGEDSTTGSTHCEDVKVYSKPFVTSLKPRPTWDHRLILKKEKYVRGSSENMENRLERPDVKDFITLDWLKVTKYDKISN